MDKHKAQADSLELRVEQLETELKIIRSSLNKTLFTLEEHLNRDIDSDGRKGVG